MTDTPTPEAIEAAAKALHQSRMSRPSELAWLSLDVLSRDLWIKEATAALSAAYPLMEAQAKAEALREAAGDPTLRLSGHSGISITRLRARAAAIASDVTS